MLKKLLYFFIFFTFFLQVTSQQPTCSNYNTKDLNLLKESDWIPVKWDNGNCYFHNTKTKENKDKHPILK